MHQQDTTQPQHTVTNNPPKPVTAETRTLTSWGLNETDAHEWTALNLPLRYPLVDRAANADRHGLSPAAYTNWCQLRDWTPREAVAFLRAGFSQAEATFARTLLRHAAHKRQGDPAALTEAWLACPLSPAWICRTLAIGITHPDTAHALFARSINEPALVRTIDINADFRGANNRDLIIDHAQLKTMGVQRLPLDLLTNPAAHPRFVSRRPHSANILWAVDDSAEPD